MNWYLAVLKKYAVFSGRARRKEYWMFCLINFIIAFALGFIEGMIRLVPGSGVSVFGAVYGLAVLIPGIAVSIRRMHDTDHSGWWVLVPIVNLVFAVSEGTAGANRFGSDPKVGLSKLPVQDPTVTPTSGIELNDSVIPNWKPPTLVPGDEYERRCLTAEFHEEAEERTFRSENAFADVLAAFNSGRFDDTIRLGTALIPRFRDFDLPWLWVCLAYEAKGQLELAHQAATEGLARTKRKSNLLSKLGDIEWQRGNLPESVYALSQVLHCYADHPLDYNAYLLLSYVAEGVGLFGIAAGFLRQVDSLRSGTIRLTAAQADRLLGLSRRAQAPSIARVVEGLSEKYLKTQAPPVTHGEQKYYERDNRGDRQDALETAVAYWVQRWSLPFKDPFVVYTFSKQDDAREALLALPCIKIAADSGNLICTERLIFGYYRQQDGTYEAILCGSGLTDELWAQAGEQFTKHGGKQKNELAPKADATFVREDGKPTNELAPKADATFVREDRKPTRLGTGAATYRIYRSRDMASAYLFLERNVVDKDFLYIIVETPEGNVGRDINGIYRE